MLHTIESAVPETTSSKTRILAILAGFALVGALAVVPAAVAQDGGTPVAPQNTSPAAGPRVRDTSKIAPGRIASYDNKYEIYGGIDLMNGQAGQNLPKRYNMGGVEVMGTYWLGDHLGVAADYRFEAGTTPLFPNPYYNRVVIMQSIVSGGVEWRGPRNRYFAIDYQAFGGATHGIFDHAIQAYPGGSPISATGLGLYPNTTSPFGAVGGSIDFNYSANIAIRFQPDMIIEHFGTETREFVALSTGVVYRFGKR